jgi:hypothetical protein
MIAVQYPHATLEGVMNGFSPVLGRKRHYEDESSCPPVKRHTAFHSSPLTRHEQAPTTDLPSELTNRLKRKDFGQEAAVDTANLKTPIDKKRMRMTINHVGHNQAGILENTPPDAHVAEWYTHPQCSLPVSQPSNIEEPMESTAGTSTTSDQQAYAPLVRYLPPVHFSQVDLNPELQRLLTTHFNSSDFRILRPDFDQNSGALIVYDPSKLTAHDPNWERLAQDSASLFRPPPAVSCVIEDVSEAQTAGLNPASLCGMGSSYEEARIQQHGQHEQGDGMELD